MWHPLVGMFQIITAAHSHSFVARGTRGGQRVRQGSSGDSPALYHQDSDSPDPILSTSLLSQQQRGRGDWGWRPWHQQQQWAPSPGAPSTREWEQVVAQFGRLSLNLQTGHPTLPATSWRGGKEQSTRFWEACGSPVPLHTWQELKHLKIVLHFLNLVRAITCTFSSILVVITFRTLFSASINQLHCVVVKHNTSLYHIIVTSWNEFILDRTLKMPAVWIFIYICIQFLKKKGAKPNSIPLHLWVSGATPLEMCIYTTVTIRSTRQIIYDCAKWEEAMKLIYLRKDLSNTESPKHVWVRWTARQL